MSTIPTDLPAIEPVVADDGDRHDRLSEATAGLGRSRSGPDRWFQIAGGVLLALGVIVILLGWYGAAHTTRVWEQMPYLVSGGFLGSSLVFAGGFCYFAYWLTKLVEESRQHAANAAVVAERSAVVLEHIEALLREGAAAGRPGAGLTGRGSRELAGAGLPLLVATATGTMVHRPDCTMVQGKENLREVRPDEPGLRPCLVCEPQLATTNGSSRDRARDRAAGL